MNISNIWNGHGAVSAVIAAAIVGVSGLALDRGHTVSSASGADVAIALAPTDVLPRVAALPEIVVTAKRLAGASRQAGA
ncbi:MAG: hypothetical protein ACREVI_15615 [Steroidobacteraceae bacterium]